MGMRLLEVMVGGFASEGEGEGREEGGFGRGGYWIGE